MPPIRRHFLLILVVAITFFYFALKKIIEWEFYRLYLLEIILNIYLIIENGFVTAFKVKSYEMEGGDDNKILFLKSRVVEDYTNTYHLQSLKSKECTFNYLKKYFPVLKLLKAHLYV